MLQLQEKCRSKKELYTFLTQDGHAYLPKIDSTNVYFFRQIISGKKEVRCIWVDLTPFLVYQKRWHQSISCPSDRRPHDMRLPRICEEPSRHAQLLARYSRLGSHGQKMDLRCALYSRPRRHPRDDQGLYGNKEDQGGTEQASQFEYEAWVCLGSSPLSELQQ